jgi:hypothetical protein
MQLFKTNPSVLSDFTVFSKKSKENEKIMIRFDPILLLRNFSAKLSFELLWRSIKETFVKFIINKIFNVMINNGVLKNEFYKG